MSKIAVIYTTFLRENLAIKTYDSIVNNWNKDYILLVGDQGNQGHTYKTEKSIMYYLPFDCGLSYARNYLVQKAAELGCKYCLVTADSIEFTKPYDFFPIIEFMESDNKIAKVGLKLTNRVPWEFDMELIPGKYFELIPPRCATIGYPPREPYALTYQQVDICKNFFLAKTQALLDVPWDNELKLSEHEDHCWRLKQAGYKTYTSDFIEATYIDYKPEEYNKYRHRIYTEYRKKLQQKYNITGWVTKKST